MIKKFCTSCGQDTWHNPQGAKAKGSFRCTYCGSPVSTGPKRETNEALRVKQVKKLGRLV